MPPPLSSTALPWYQDIRPSRTEASAAADCIHSAFERQAGRTPDRAILVDESGYLTYAELRSAVDALAVALLKRCQGRPGQPGVGVLLENDAGRVITYFACLKAGLPYVPLQPGRRVLPEQVPGLAPLGALVTSRRIAADLPCSLAEGVPRIWIEDEADPLPDSAGAVFPDPDPRRTAHLAFTSGTRTGIPRMVATDHAGSMLSHAWRGRLWPFDAARDVVGCNIFGIWDVVPALCRGVPVVLVRDETMRDLFALASAIVRFGITRIMMTPSLLGACLDCGEGVEALRRLRLLVLCGEIAAPAIVERAWKELPAVRIGNLYSTAECHDVAGGELRPGKEITCGVVADFAEVHLCEPDDPSRLVPVGSPGRILVGGGALARACHGSGGEEGDGFLEVDLPAADGSFRPARVFDTGDLGVLHPGGELEILGRCDSGLKIRGSWVEPARIEQVVEEHPLVRRACVTAETGHRGETELEAYVVPGPEGAEAADLDRELRPYVASRLPPQAAPARFIPVDELPLLPSGKVDRRRLRLTARNSRVSPNPRSEADPLQRQVLAAFRQALDDPAIGPRDDFEASGGHSLRAVRLCGLLHQATGRRVAVADLYRHPTPVDLARCLRDQQGMEPPSKWTPPELEIDAPPAPGAEPRTPARTVLVTGATGSLGAAFVKALLRTTSVDVLALVRAEDEGLARRRLDRALERHEELGLDARGPDQRPEATPGDPSRPGLDARAPDQRPEAAPGDPSRRGSSTVGRTSVVVRPQTVSGDRSTPGPGAADRKSHSGSPTAVPPDPSRPLPGTEARDIPGRLQAIPGDLSKPLMGLAPHAFAALADRVDAVFHLAADLDAFASYADLAPANVGGTREVLRLAFRRGAPVHNVSSSAVFPLETSWPEETFGLQAMRSLGAHLEASGADGYSLSKLGAELLLWSAFERGLPVSVVRVPHLLADSGGATVSSRDRLTAAVRAFAAAGVFPEGDWSWQLAPVDAVCRELISGLQKGPPKERPVRHLAMEPLPAAQVLDGLRGLGMELEPLPLPALASALISAAQGGAGCEAARSDPGFGDVCAAAQLILQHGPRAALNLADARLLTERNLPGNPAALFLHSIGRHAELAPPDEPLT